MTADKERFLEISEIGPEISSSLVSYFSEPQNRAVIADLLACGFQIGEGPKPVNRDTRFAGKTFVFTGGLDSYTREEAKRLVEDRGAKVASTVSKRTSYVVAGTDAGSKLEEARKLGIHVLTEREFAGLLGGES